MWQMFALLGAAAAVGSALAPPALPLANSTTVSGKARTRGNERTLLSIDPRRLRLQLSSRCFAVLLPAGLCRLFSTPAFRRRERARRWHATASR